MPLAPAITDLAELKNHPAIARLLGWKESAVQGVKFDREEMTIYVDRSDIREACALLRDDSACPFNFLSDVTCVDWYPAEPRFEVVYHLLSISKKERIRLKVRLNSSSPTVDSITSVWPGANYFEREVYDLFAEICPVVLSVTLADTDRARDLLGAVPGISARDAVHAAVMLNHEIEWIATFDKEFDRIAGVRRMKLA